MRANVIVFLPTGNQAAPPSNDQSYSIVTEEKNHLPHLGLKVIYPSCIVCRSSLKPSTRVEKIHIADAVVRVILMSDFLLMLRTHSRRRETDVSRPFCCEGKGK